MSKGHPPEPFQIFSHDLPASEHNIFSAENAPLVSALAYCARRQNAAFYTPGHKRGQGIAPIHRHLFGDTAFQADLPELPELDNLFAPEGVIAQAQNLAAQLFGADKTWFLANGSTCGIEAALLCVSQPGKKVLIPRNAHTSAISGLVLSGAHPVYITPQYSKHWDIPLAIDPKTVDQALTAHPDTTAVVIVSPTYHGICSDIAAIAQITHRHNIPLIVDEAHGPHFCFHPQLPAPALATGADIVVQSTHKVLSAFTQAAMLHVKGSRINRHRLSQALQLTQSTSPSYLLLGSLDAARYQMATSGKALTTNAISLADQAAHQLHQLDSITVLQPTLQANRNPEEGDFINGDRTRLTVDVSGLGITGFQADEFLNTRYGVTAELPALRSLTFIISIGNTAADITQLIYGFTQLQAQLNQQSTTHSASTAQLPTDYDLSVKNESISSLTPRQAFFTPSSPLPCAEAIGKVCAETICPYPPGIPVLLPGENITATALTQLQNTLSAGGLVTGCQDPTLSTILTVNS